MDYELVTSLDEVLLNIKQFNMDLSEELMLFHNFLNLNTGIIFHNSIYLVQASILVIKI